MQERYRLEEFDRLHAGQNGLLQEPIPTDLPIITKTELLTGIHGSHEFERVERLSTSIHLLEYEADGGATGVLPECDNRHLIVGEVVDDLDRKLVDQGHVLLAGL